MSKCDISIEFDRADSTYRGGDTVNGTAHVIVNKDMTSRGIRLSHFWKTHGRGNTNTGDIHVETVAEDAKLVAGETFSFPFSFQAEKEPVTYRGNYINIDHFVKIEVDVPWARDPKLESEYILLPGISPQAEHELDGEADESDGSIPWWAWFILVPMIVAFSPVLLPIYIYVTLRDKAIAKRLGEVELETSEQVLAPGDRWKTHLRFTPKRDVRINGIRARLKVWEVAVSGSGTNKTTYTHKLHEDTITVEPAGVLSVGKPFDREIEVPLPEIAAYSFSSGSNHIHWSVQIRIDLPGIPDWKEEEYLEVIPAEFTSSTSPAPLPVEPPVAEPSPTPAEPVAAESPVATAPAPSTPSPVGPAEPITATAASASPLATLLAQLADGSHSGSERAQLLESMQGQVLPVTVEIERSVSTFASQEGDQYNDGYTLTGVLAGTELAVELFTLASSRAQVQDLRRGDQWSTSARAARWDTLYNRLVLLQTG